MNLYSSPQTPRRGELHYWVDLAHDLEQRRQQRGEQRPHWADCLHLLLSCVRLPWASRLHLHILLSCTHEVSQLLNVKKLIESCHYQRLRSVGPQGKGRSENTRRANSKVHPTCLYFMSPGTKHLALGTSPKPSKWGNPEKKLSKCSSGNLKSGPVGNYDRSLIQKTSPHVCRSELLFKIGAARNLRREQYLSKTPPLFKHLFIYQNVAYNWLAFLEIPNKGFYEPVKCTVM